MEVNPLAGEGRVALKGAAGRLVFKAAGPEAAVRAMQKFPLQEGVQAASCALLCALGPQDTHRRLPGTGAGEAAVPPSPATQRPCFDSVIGGIGFSCGL